MNATNGLWNVRRRSPAGRRLLCIVIGVAAIGFAGAAGATGYGPAGCGLGSVIVGNGDGFSQVFAATTNGTSASQTFGITSGTSNCDQHNKTNVSQFIQTNREALAKDMARGQGETIAALSDMAGCKDAARVGARLQSEFRKVIPDATASDESVSENVLELLKSDSALSCQLLS